MTNVHVDFNNTARGMVKASTRRATGPLAVGQYVWALDNDEGLAKRCLVESIEDSGRVWLRPLRWTEPYSRGFVPVAQTSSNWRGK